MLQDQVSVNPLNTVAAIGLANKSEYHLSDFSPDVETTFGPPNENVNFLQKSVDSVLEMFFTKVAGGD